MDFRIGKYYRTRDGRKTKCIEIGLRAASFDQSLPVWIANGFFGVNPHPDDIVAEWTDEPPAVMFDLNPPTSDTVYRNGDVVYVRGVMEINPHDHDKPTRINFGAGVNCTPHFKSVKVVHHEPAPREIKVGDDVTTEDANGMIYRVTWIENGEAWLRWGDEKKAINKFAFVANLRHAD